MQTYLHGRDLIGDLDFSKEEVETVLDVAFDLKRKRALNEPHAYLRDKVLAMLFFFSSTRTRGSFEAGMAQLGGHGAFIDSNTTQISHGDTPKEIGEIFGRYFDGIAIRHCDWGRRQRLPERGREGLARAGAEHAVRHLPPVPVPGRPDDDHREEGPRSAQEEDGRLVGLCRIVPQADLGAAVADPADAALRHGCRPGLPARVQADARYRGCGAEQARKFKTGFEIISDPNGMDAAFKDADIIYAKSWGPLLTTADKVEGKKIQDTYKHWITDERKMALAQPDAIYMHPLPADRNIEVTDGVIDGPNSVVYDEAENRLHAQKAVMALTM